MAVTQCRHKGAPCEATPSPLAKTPRIHKGWDPRRVGSTEGLGPEEFCSPVLFEPQRTPSNGVPGKGIPRVPPDASTQRAVPPREGTPSPTSLWPTSLSSKDHVSDFLRPWLHPETGGGWGFLVCLDR